MGADHMYYHICLLVIGGAPNICRRHSMGQPPQLIGRYDSPMECLGVPACVYMGLLVRSRPQACFSSMRS